MEDENGGFDARRAWLRWLGVGTGSLALVLAALWTQRAPIAENFVSRELNRRDVRARYDLVDVGLRTQRIENIVLGDPANPDLTARWVEVDVAFAGLTPHVAAVRAGGVRLRGTAKGGVLKLGELDRFRDPASTAPFSLPDLRLALTDARVMLDTDAGPVGMQIDGSGHLRSGFRGVLAAAMPRADLAGCAVRQAVATLDVTMTNGRPRLVGPVAADTLGCSGAGIAMAQPSGTINLALSDALDHWTGDVDMNAKALQAGGLVLATPRARVDYDGTADRTAGRLRVNAGAVAGAGARVGKAALTGDWSIGKGETTLKGRLLADDLHFANRDPLAGLRASGAGTPVGPLATRLADAVAQAGRRNRIGATLAVVNKGGAGSLALTDSQFSARSGARAGLAPDSRLTIAWPGKAGGLDWALDGSVTTQGGGLPKAALRLARRAGGGFGGQLFVDPYAAGDARLALDRVRFSADRNGATRFATAVRLDGPLPDGGVRGLSLPVSGRIGANGAVAINPDCVPLSITQARYGSFAIGPTRQTLCPAGDGAMLAVDGRGARGGVAVRDLLLNGTSGDSPMRLAADAARYRLGSDGFALENAAFTLGPADSPVALTAARMVGAASASGLGGTLSGAGGQIGSVPLIVEQGEGTWRFDKGALSLAAKLIVRDSQKPFRFQPLPVPDFTLTMADGRIAAKGTLTAPRGGTALATVDIAHDLDSAKGWADLNVAGLRFDKGLQPEDITPLTLGVVANVDGTVTGKGRIDWSGSDVRSTGTFRTDNASLAAAFGPVTGLSGEIRFTDLINLVTAPGQVVRIASVNPGVEAKNGVVRYRLEAGQTVRIEGGGWPFSGGELVLLPTKMDFSADVDRYMTFRVIGLDAGAFIQAMELENVSATGTFDGIMPLIFNAQGGQIAGGVLVARQQGLEPLLMPEGVLPTIPCDPTRQGGTLSYVGPVSNEDIGVMGKIAFDALKNLQYKCLSILMDGALDGEMVTNVVFNGVNRDRLGGVPAGLAGSFIGLPFIFNVKISAPFRGLLKTAQSYVDPSETIREEIGRQTQEKMRADAQQTLAVQPLDSDTLPNGEQQ